MPLSVRREGHTVEQAFLTLCEQALVQNRPLKDYLPHGKDPRHADLAEEAQEVRRSRMKSIEVIDSVPLIPLKCKRINKRYISAWQRRKRHIVKTLKPSIRAFDFLTVLFVLAI